MEERYRIFEVLLVEDNPGHVRLMVEALKESQIPNDLSVVMDGIEALAFLHREGKYFHAPRPDLIFLDLKLPRRNGFEVLAKIKNDPELKRIPVIVFASSSDEKDILKSYDLCANAYITKPIDFDQFITVVKYIENFWFNVVKLPSGG